MDIEKLKLFISLAETKHFSRAADRTHVSPSKLTRVIQQIEQHFDTQLFDRDNRSVSLTTKGEAFLQHCRELIQQWETLEDTMQDDSKQLKGALSIYCSVTASYSFLYDILQAFRLEQPKIEIKLHTGDPAPALERVQAGFEDVAIAARPDRLPSGVAFKRITKSPLVFIAPQESFPPEGISKKPSTDWKDMPFILSERGIARERFDQWLDTQLFTPRIYAQAAGHEAIVSMVSLGFGLGLVPKIVLDNSPLANKVRLFDYQPRLKPYDVGICVQEKRLRSPLVRAFWEKI